MRINRLITHRCVITFLFVILYLTRAESQIVGYTAVSPSVGENGDSRISIPINCPKGTFIQPKLALSYSSHTGNGLQGVGFSLEGVFQSISRLPSTVAQDGVADGVDFDALDRFALNGERLMAISGADGADNTEYRTEQNSFSRVKSFGNIANTGPERFLVQTKDGLTLEFGYTPDSRIEGSKSSRVLTWLLNKITDTNGNYLKITYAEDNLNGEFRPILIEYTGNTIKELRPYNKVVLNYETRPDIVIKYYAGHQFKTTQRLREIICYEKNVIFRKYSLQYSGTSGNSKLIKVTESGIGGDGSIRPVEFNWITPTASNFNFTKPSSGNWQGHGGGIQNNVAGDFDGDGKTDLAGYSGNWNWHVSLSNGKNFQSALWKGHPGGTKNNVTGDFNGDGKADLAGYSEGGKWHVCLSNGSGFQSSVWQGHGGGSQNNVAGDFNGDGRTDLAGHAGNGQWHVVLSTGTNFQGTFWNGHAGGVENNVVGDFNGDGKTDLAGYSGNWNWHVSLSTGTNFQSALWQGHPGGAKNNVIGDFNGDGLTDIAGYAGDGKWHVCLSTGTNFQSAVWQGHPGGVENNIVGDFNGDGMTDLAGYSSNGKWHVSLSTGTNFQNTLWAGHGGGASNNVIGDFDGNGCADITGYTGVNGVWHVTMSNALKEFISSVRNGNGVSTSFTYEPLTDPNTYTKGTTASYPLTDFIGAMYVAKSITTNDGIGGTRTTNYTYENAKFDLSGRGLRGFGKITMSDPIANSVVATTYDRGHQCIAARVLKTEVKTSTGQLIKLVENQIQRVAMHSGKVCFSYYTKTTEKNYEPGQSAPYATKDVDYAYDTYGNATIIKERYNYSSSYEVTTTNNYTNDESRWILGRLTESTVTKTLAGKAAIRKNSTFAYDGNGNLISEIFLPTSTTRKVQTIYVLDVFGNRVKKTISGIGFTSRSESYTLDTEGRNVLTATNALGHTERFSYTNGMLASETDANGLVTRITRDAFGREMRTDYPDGTWETINYYYCGSGIGACPGKAIYYFESKASGGVTSRVYHDELDRVIREEKETFMGALVYVDHIYNANGTKKSVTDGYLSGGAIYSTNFEYDALQRLVKETKPGNRITNITYAGLSKTITNAEGQKQTTIENPMGKTSSVTDAVGSILSYDYDSDLNIVSIRYPNGQSITNTFDVTGFKISTTDPDMGRYTYEYNALGLQTKQTNAKSESITIEYDLLDRPIKKVEPEGTTTWRYDPVNAKGQIGGIAFNNIEVEAYEYNVHSKLIVKTYLRNGTNKKFRYTYHVTNGALETETYPNGLSIKHIYNSRGYETEVRNNATNVLLWKADSYDQDDMLTSFSLGNGLKTSRTFDPITGTLRRIQTGKTTTPGSLQNLGFTYSALGNVSTRSDDLFGLIERFSYDNLNRLINAQVAKQGGASLTPVTLTYDALGNITYKSDVGKYRYGENGTGPHVLTSIDHAGVSNCIYPFNQDIGYTSYNYVSRISNQNSEVLIGYGPTRDRQSVVAKKAGKVVMDKAIYGGVYEEVKDAAGVVTVVCYLRGGSEVFGFYSKTGTQAEKVTYLLKDHLGSVYAHASQAGVVEQRFSYDAWGKPRNPETWVAYPTIPGIPNFQRGFTFHEMLDIDGLVCMNARVYNPVLGRFLSADPFVQFPEDLQSYNRYSYVLNNPLTLVDPTGFFSLKKFIKQVAGVVVGAAITIATGGVGLPVIFSGALAGFGGAFTDALVNGAGLGDAFKAGLKGGAMGAVSAAVAYGVGSGFSPIMEKNPALYRELIVAKAIVHGATQGTVSEAFGGDFKNGFVGAFVSNLGYDAIESSGYFTSAGSRVVAAAIVGGTASDLSGGKFANGAVSAAFVAMFNEESHPESDNESAINYTQNLDLVFLALPFVDAFLPFGDALSAGYFTYRANKVAQTGYKVYQGVDKAGVVRYVGITRRSVAVRTSEHLSAKGTGKELLTYRQVGGKSNLTRSQARNFEQNLINKHGLSKNGGTLLNKINSVAPK